ncbi:ribonuclease Z [Cuneatibacter caecimuris]|uniref:Ribonuclease Z n=1 Tax=Cuneatibacter caecimuris TaxID=1796618 RepID=A0A4Q7NWY1_9FIRM|nr:ribonuclease Z [Cuneatibacter caecimuris]RZS91851.1 ribonuclease Z [Cuneatibacter caecimuris]
MLDVCLLGTGGMMPLPYRWLTSLMLRLNGSSLMIDCGEGTQIAVKEKGWSFKPVDVLCITHFHADHISGLPGLLLTMGNAERTEPLTIIGPKGVERIVGALRMIAPELPFPIRFVELTEQIQQISLCGYEITAFRVNHNVICYGYTVSVPRVGRFSVDRAREQEIPMKFWNRLQKGEVIEEDGRVLTPDMVLGADRKGLKVTYCTDTRPVPVIAEQAEGADLFICEGMYGEPGKEGKAREYKHMTMYEAAKLARQAKPERMWLTHFSPSLNRPEEFMGEVRKIFPSAVAGKDGMSLELEFEEDE